jgi:NAD-dependent deacetylase
MEVLAGRRLWHNDGMPTEIPQPLIKAFRNAQNICVLTGAGISKESGIPTFREAQTGLWEKYDPAELATPEAFKDNPKLVWEWYQWRRELCAKAKPNGGHLALAEMQQRCPAFTLITQNVDGLHARAGSTNIIELHGNITRSKCFDTGEPCLDVPTDSGEFPPRHPQTGGLLWPDVVWFNEQLPPDSLKLALNTAHQCDLFLSIGTSTLVYPEAALPFQALDNGATVIEINPEPTQLTPLATYSLHSSASEALRALLVATSDEA